MVLILQEKFVWNKDKNVEIYRDIDYTKDMKKNNSWLMMGLAYQLVTDVIFPLFIGVVGGKWLDGYFGTEKWFTLGGLLLGLFFSLYVVWQLINQLMEK